MTVGEINKGAVVLIIVLALAGGGFLWWSKMYKPAVAARVAAEQAATTAEGGLTQARTELEAAQKRVEEAKSESSKPDDAVGRLALATAAVPKDKLLDDAAIVLMSMADRSGINTNFKAADTNDTSATATTGSSLNGATPVDIEFEATGTYAEMMQFMSLVEGTATVKDGKLYSRGRLFNVSKLEIGAPSEEESASNSGFENADEDTSKPVLGPNDIQFTVTVRMYVSSDANAASVGEATPDPAAAATTTDPNAAAGTTGTDPNAAAGAGGTTTTTDPNAASSTGTPSTDGAGATSAGTAGAGTAPATDTTTTGAAA